MEYIIYVPFILLLLGIVLIFATGLKLLGRIISTLALCMIAVTAWILTVFMIALSMTYQTIYIVSATAFITATLALFVCLVWGAVRKKAAYIPIVSVILLLPAIVVALANFHANLGVLFGDPLGMPSYIVPLTAVVMAFAGFVEVILRCGFHFIGYYCYGSIDTQEEEKKKFNQEIQNI